MNEQPNIIFIFSDQQRWDTVGCYGQKLPVTPNLDQMALEGVRFNHAFTCQPVCGPARACLQTGQYATETGCFRNGIGLPQSDLFLADYFNKAGYETAYIGKWHLATTDKEASSEEHPAMDYATVAIPPKYRGGYKDFWIASDVLEFTSHGYGGYMFDGDMKKRTFEGYRADATTDFALEYLEHKTSDAPFYMMISYIEPHHQNDRNTYEGPIGSKERFKDYDVPGDLEGTEGDWREHYPDYLGCCHNIDENVGRIRKTLEAKGLSDNTVILYTSDHGSHFRTRNDEYKRSCHDASLHIPMIAVGPGFLGGKVIEEMVSLLDVPTTLLASAGIKRPSQMRGQTLQSVVSGHVEAWPEEVFVQISESQVGRAIRTKRYKYAVEALGEDGWLRPSSQTYHETFLYDLEKDPHERCNLVRDEGYVEIRHTLAERLKERMVKAGEKMPVIMSAKDL